MTPRAMLAAFWVLLFAGAPSAQPSDPVSGRWGLDGAPFLVLKFDGKRSVSGTTIWHEKGQMRRSPIKTGTYDVKTRALRIEGVDERPDGAVAYVIEGRIDGDTLAGTFKQGNAGGNFTFTRLKAPPAK